MKVTEHIERAKGNTLFSFEIIPPVKGRNIKELYDNIDPLMDFNPPFIDVTTSREEYIYIDKNGLSSRKTYSLFVRKIEDGVETEVNRAMDYLWEKKLALTLQIRDIFQTSRREGYTYGQGFETYRLSERKAPVIMLNLTLNLNNFKQKRDSNKGGGDDEGEDF